MLFDEPLEGMDRGIRRDIVGWVERRIADGASAVVVSHEFEAFAPLARRAVTVRNGRCHTIDPLPPPGPDRIVLLDGLAVGDDAVSGRPT